MKTTAISRYLASALGALLLAGAVIAQEGPPPLPHLAQAKLDVPLESPGIPIYVRMENTGPFWVIPRNAEWSAIVFYRDPDCVPTDFDLGDGIDLPGPQGLGAFGCPSLVEGYDLRINSVDPMMPPDYMFMRNLSPEHPIWFVASTELEPLLDRGFVYLDEIEALPSRVAGNAWKFEEQLRPSGANTRPSVTISARGRLETGGQFSLFWHIQTDIPDFFDRSSSKVLENVFELEADLPTASVHPGCRVNPSPRVCR